MILSFHPVDNTEADFAALDEAAALGGDTLEIVESQLLARACYKRAEAARERGDLSDFAYGYYMRRAAQATRSALMLMGVYDALTWR